MRRTKSLFTLLAAGLLIAAPLAAQADPAEIIDERQEFMKGLGQQLGVARSYVQDGEGTAADVAEAARTIAERAGEIVALFPEGTGMHEVDIETGARPEIWEDPDDFAAKAEGLSEAATSFAELAESTEDPAEIGAGMAALGRDGCGACHRTYREELD